MRIALAWNYREWGGAQMYFLGIARQLRAEAEFVMILPRGTSDIFLELCRAENIAVEFLERAVPVEPVRSLGGKLQMHWSKILSEIELVRTLSKGGFNLIHTDLSPWQSLVSLILLSFHSPVLYTVHNRLPKVSALRRASWRIKFWIAARCRRIRACASNEDARLALADYAPSSLVQSAAVTFTNVNRVELDAVPRTMHIRRRYRSRLGISDEEFVATVLGQFIDRKGRWTLLEALCDVVRQESGIRFFWITNSDISIEDETRIRSFGLGDSFTLLKMDRAFDGRGDMLGFVGNSDLFVLPSQVEGLPIALLEAMYLGVPSISTRVNGIPEAIEDGVTGLLIEPGDAEGLANAILALVRNGEVRDRLGLTGRGRVAENFVEERVALKVLSVYRSLLQHESLETAGVPSP